MKKIFGLIAFCIIVSGTLSGCGSGSNTSNSSSTEASNISSEADTSDSSVDNNSEKEEATIDPIELVIEDSNYVVDNGYVHYAVCVRNDNDAYKAEFTRIKITGRKSDGSIGFSDDWTLGDILPKSVTYWASQAGDGNVEESDTIEISISTNDDDWQKSSVTMPDDLYTFENVSVSNNNYGGLKATGEMTLKKDGSNVGIDNVVSPIITCILKDDAGKIVGGFSGYLDSDLKEGEKEIFDISSYNELGEYATAEMYAYPWW